MGVHSNDPNRRGRCMKEKGNKLRHRTYYGATPNGMRYTYTRPIYN